MNKGKLIQIIGSVFDAKFEEGQIPAVFNALEIPGEFSGGK
jgi:F0F1-type ATP synthase beta subunit